MPSPTDFNLSPYYDDFNESKKFHRILFRPSFAVQARELTQSQSILQNQVERISDHLFEKGAMVIPGEIGYNLFYYSSKTYFIYRLSCRWCYIKRFYWFKINRRNFRCNSKSNWCMTAADGTDP